MADQQQVPLSMKITGTIPTGKITANSTAPTTLTAGGYTLIKSGNIARLNVYAAWSSAGTTNTTATFTLDDVLTALAAKGLTIVPVNEKVAGLGVANDSASATAILDTGTAKTAVATFSSASLTKVEATFVLQVA